MPDQPQLPLGQADPDAAPARRSGGCAGRGGSALARGAPDPRGRDGGGIRRNAHSRPGRPQLDHRAHRRGHRARSVEARHLGLARRHLSPGFSSRAQQLRIHPAFGARQFPPRRSATSEASGRPPGSVSARPLSAGCGSLGFVPLRWWAAGHQQAVRRAAGHHQADGECASSRGWPLSAGGGPQGAGGCRAPAGWRYRAGMARETSAWSLRSRRSWRAGVDTVS